LRNDLKQKILNKYLKISPVKHAVNEQAVAPGIFFYISIKTVDGKILKISIGTDIHIETDAAPVVSTML
jgi:hypothetical protein